MYIDHHIKQVGKVLTCTDSSGKIVVNKYDNKTSRIIFDLDGTIPGKLYFALLNPTTKKYFLTPINNNEIEITSAISVYPGLWSAIIIGADVNYEIIDNNIDQTKLTYISDEFKKIVVRDNFLNELNIEESQSPANLFDFLSEAQGYVVLSKRYAVGDEKVEGSDVDNAKYYMNETKKLLNNFEGTVKDTVVEVVENQMDILGNEIERVDSELNQALSETNQSVEELNDELYHFKINTEERIKTLEERDIDVDITVDSELNPESENPIQNKVVTKALDNVTKDVADVKSDLEKKADSIELERVASEVETLKENEVTAEDIANLGFWKEEDGKNYIDSETSKSVNIALEEAKASGEFDGAEGPQGPKGDTGEQGPRGETGATGAKGDKGDKGDTGASGKDGKDGTSVTVSSVSESNVDGGSNVVTFSDGKTMTIKNGSKGSTGAKGEKGDRGEKGETGSSGAKGADGYTPQKNVDYFDGKDGVSATHSWNGTVLTITSASGSSSADLKGSDGKDGTDGVSGKDGVSVTHKWNGTTLTVTSASGTSSADLKGDKGDTGATGKTAYEYAQDGGYTGTETAFAEKLAQNTYSKTEVDTKFTQVNTALDDLETDVTNVKSDLKEYAITVTESGSSLVTDKTVEEITDAMSNGKCCFVLYNGRAYSYSYEYLPDVYIFKHFDTSDEDLNGKSSVSVRTIKLYCDGSIYESPTVRYEEEVFEMGYTLTDADKQDIAELVENVTFYERPTYVDSEAEMTDTSKEYILKSTGTVWRYEESTTKATITDRIVGTTENPYEGGRLGSDGKANGNAGYVTSPLIDLTKYSVPFTLHVKGIDCVYGHTSTSGRACSQFKTDKTHIARHDISSGGFGSYWTSGCAQFTDNGDGTCSILFTPPLTNKSSVEIGYIRVCGSGTEADANIYIEYEGETTSYGFVDTGVEYGSSGSNNEVVDITVFNLVNPSVKSFMESADYNDSDYSYTNVNNYTSSDYFRKDLPLPIVLNWEKDVSVLEYTVSINTQSGVLNTGMQTYYTEGNKCVIYNLIPNTTYYYKIYGLYADSSKKLLKDGSFTTTGNTTRMLKIDGIQNVRDIGGYTGLNGKTVKYGLLYRGSTMDELVVNTLRITDDGKKEMLTRVGIRSDLDLRGANNVTESVLGSDVDFFTTPYSYLSYASAITDTTSMTNFKDILEYIVDRVTAQKPIYIHCSGGCDRTGTLVFLLLGLLGVSESDLAKEYELTSFSNIGKKTRTRNSTTYDYSGMVSALKIYSGDTITDKFVAFATACGISSDTITSFRSLLLS